MKIPKKFGGGACQGGQGGCEQRVEVFVKNLPNFFLGGEDGRLGGQGGGTENLIFCEN